MSGHEDVLGVRDCTYILEIGNSRTNVALFLCKAFSEVCLPCFWAVQEGQYLRRIEKVQSGKLTAHHFKSNGPWLSADPKSE